MNRGGIVNENFSEWWCRGQGADCCCNQAWLLKNSIFFKTARIWGIENV
jgi:hypothetical protein